MRGNGCNATCHSVFEPDGMTFAARPRVAYLGWHGRGNLGDDAIYDAVRAQLAGATFVDQPVLTRELIPALANGVARSLRHSTLVVGGGTLIGTRHFRRLVKRGLLLTRGHGYAIGVGVEDPSFTRRRRCADEDELKRWAPLLSGFDIVSVRGPRSAELLAEAGLNVAVSGDPALLLPPPDVTVQDGLIGVNLGFGDEDLWGYDPAAVAGEMAVALRRLSHRGYRLVGILMNDADHQWTQTALADIPAEIIHPADAGAAARELARCSVVVASRLHASILAAVSATPTVALEYQPKCRDFARSVGNERFLLRTDTLTSTAVVDQVTDALAQTADIRADTATAVSRLRTQLDTEYRALAQHLGLHNR